MALTSWFRGPSSAALMLAVVALMTSTKFNVDAQTCLMVYHTSPLDLFTITNYAELSVSPLVRKPDVPVRTWVYVDSFINDGTPLPNTVDSEGNDVFDLFSGSRYMTYDPTFERLRVDVELVGEQNSNTEAAVSDFMEHALADCLANGYNSTMAIFAGAGGGFAGFGSADSLQTNAGLASAIRTALDSAGGPTKLEVLGFDASLMQAIGAADDYGAVADYILASESIVPGHGLAYDYLRGNGTSALALAGEALTTYLDQTQGKFFHETPKTMSILDTTKFSTFVTAFEAFFGMLLTELQGGDISLYAFVSRSRDAAVAFTGIIDAVGTEHSSSLDIGSWLDEFASLCSPTNTLQELLSDVAMTYDDMFVDQGVGPGTQAGTGMHVTWPIQTDYNSQMPLWNQVLFNNANYVTTITPNFTAFLEWFLPSSVPTSGNTATTVCAFTADLEDLVGDALIITDSGMANETAGTYTVEATLSPNVSLVLVEYGIDLTTALGPVLEEKGYIPSVDDYLTLLGGNVADEYEGSTYKGTWDQNFYFLNISNGGFEALYVNDEGDGSRRIPVMYFPEESIDSVANLQFLDFLFFDFDYWTGSEEGLGANYGFLRFSVNETVGNINDNLALFVSNEAGVITEQPRTAGGYLVPLIYVEAYVQGRLLTTMAGGFNQTVVSWSEELDYNVVTVSAEKTMENVYATADAVVVSMFAFSSSSDAKPDARYYYVMSPEIEGIDVDNMDDEQQTTISPSTFVEEVTATPMMDDTTTLSPTVAAADATAAPTETPVDDESSSVERTGKDDLGPKESDEDEAAGTPAEVLTNSSAGSITKTRMMILHAVVAATVLSFASVCGVV